MVLTRSQCKQSEDPTFENFKGYSKIHQKQTVQFWRLDVDGDGNCLFRVVSLFLFGHQNNHIKLRQEAVSCIWSNWVNISPYILVDDHNLNTSERYLEYMNKDGVFGTSLEIMALAKPRKLRFHIYNEAYPSSNVIFVPKESPTLIYAENCTRDI